MRMVLECYNENSPITWRDYAECWQKTHPEGAAALEDVTALSGRPSRVLRLGGLCTAREDGRGVLSADALVKNWAKKSHRRQVHACKRKVGKDRFEQL